MNLSDAANWTNAVATALAVIVALFKDELLRYWRRPQLVAELRSDQLSLQKTVVAFQHPETKALEKRESYYFRIWVENRGKQRAERVQVYADSLSRQQANGDFRPVGRFLPMNLCWTHGLLADNRPEVYADGISPKMGRLCDVGIVLDSQSSGKYLPIFNDLRIGETVVALAMETNPFTATHVLPPGIYRLRLKLAAANAEPVTRTLEINHKGVWLENEEKMLAEGLGVRLLDEGDDG